MKMNPLSKSFYSHPQPRESGWNTLHESRMKAKALPAGVLLKHLMMLTLAYLLPSSDHGLNCEEAWCSEKEKEEWGFFFFFFSFPFLRTKKIKRTVSRPEHYWSEVKVIQLCPTLCNPMDCSPWNSPGQKTGVGSLFLFQGIFPTWRSNPGLLHCRHIPYQLKHQGSPRILEWVAYPFSRGSSQPRRWTRVSCIAGGFFTNWAIREALIEIPWSLSRERCEHSYFSFCFILLCLNCSWLCISVNLLYCSLTLQELQFTFSPLSLC